jgi:hypothetical protein
VFVLDFDFYIILLIVAEAVASTNQKILEKEVRVELLKTETQPNDRSVTSGRVLVSALPEDATERSIALHFQMKMNSKSEVKVRLSQEEKRAIVTFDDIEGQ